MPDNDVLPVSWKRWTMMGLAGVGFATIAMLVVFVSLRIHQTYGFENQVSALESAHRELVLNCTAHVSEEEARIYAIERVLFGDVVPKVGKPPAVPPSTRIEELMLRNQRELKQRVEALERFRLKMIE